MITPHLVRQRVVRYATIPNRLLAACALTVVGALVLWLAIVLAVQGARHGVQTIGRDAAPSILAAQDLRARLADLHAEAVNDLLAGGLGSAAARQAYQNDLQQIAERLVAVAQNITYPAERPPILAMQQGLITYTGLIEEARTETRHGHPVGAAFLRRADRLLHDQLLPAAQQLDDVNRQYLQAAYATRTAWSWIALGSILVLGLALSLGLCGQHVRLRRTFRRRYNLGLLGAIGLSLGLTCYVVWALWTAHTHLRIAKQDAFDSVAALLVLRAAANTANADESLWLLAQGMGEAYEQRFQANTQRILEPTVTTKLIDAGWESADGQRLRQRGQVAAAHAMGARRVATEAMAKTTRPAGLLGDILRNVTYPGEGESAIETFIWYVQYMALDSVIRTLDRQGEHAQAVALCVGTKEGQSNWAFQRFDAALDKTLQINRAGFDTAVKRAFRALWGLESLALVVLLLVGGCTIAGLWPRIAEFR